MCVGLFAARQCEMAFPFWNLGCCVRQLVRSLVIRLVREKIPILLFKVDRKVSLTNGQRAYFRTVVRGRGTWCPSVLIRDWISVLVSTLLLLLTVLIMLL